jgi:hypothetical protein
MNKQKMLAVIGFAAIIPALMLVVFGVSGLEVPKIFDSPFVILGGLVTALVINIFSVASLNTNLEADNFTGSVTVRWRDGLMNLSVIVLGFGLLAAIMLYLFLENFQPR